MLMKSLIKRATVACLVVLMLAASAVSACGGGGEGESNEIILGWLADQTGVSAQAFKEVMKGIDDCMAEMAESDPISGIELKIITYDTRLEYARYPQGYQWLIGQGMDVLLGYTPEVPLVTLTDQAEDKVPQYNFSTYATLVDAAWLYGYQYSYEYEARAVLDYLVNQWWPAQGKTGAMKVAHVDNPDLNASPEYQKGLDWVVAQNPGKIELSQTGGASSQSAWASEVAAVMGTDAVFMTMVGTSAGTFLKELAARGYQGQVVAATISVLGIWPMVVSLVDKADLDGMLIPHYYPLYTDENAFSDYLNEMIQDYRPSEAEALKKGTTWMSGWVTAEILIEAVRTAAEKVGAENVDGAAINDAFLAMTLEIEGMPDITLEGRGGHHVLQPNCRMIEYDSTRDDWYAITDWFLAPGFEA